MKNLMKALSLMVVFLSFQGLVSAAEVAIDTAADAGTAVAVDTEKTEEEKAAELKNIAEADLAAPAVAAVEAK